MHPETGTPLTLGLVWGVPFAGLLMSLAIFPSAAPQLWHRRYGLVALFWAAVFIVPFAIRFGVDIAKHDTLHAALFEYIPFIALISTLYTISGGIHVDGDLQGGPRVNVAIFLIGMGLANFIGTTGASMILIRPLIRANRHRRHNAHVIVFFIFLVSNIGGALTPLADPPLFLGYLQGVSFFWPLIHLWQPALLLSAFVLSVFCAVDTYFSRKDDKRSASTQPQSQLRISGLSVNLPLLAAVVGIILLCSGLQDSLGLVYLDGIPIPVANLARDSALFALAAISLWLTPEAHREGNDFSWAPVVEVAKLFAAIFVTIVPVISMLRQGQSGSLGFLAGLLGSSSAPNVTAYFWLTGGLSAFLDNAPTYLVFFNAAGGDAATLMTTSARTLAAISAGAVFMGAFTYVGNAPNLMVRAIAEERGIAMPGFFGFIVWSVVVLFIPLALITVLFFH